MQTLQTIAVHTAFHAIGILTAIAAWTLFLFLAKAVYDTFRDMFY